VVRVVRYRGDSYPLLSFFIDIEKEYCLDITSLECLCHIALDAALDAALDVALTQLQFPSFVVSFIFLLLLARRLRNVS
jgi:hypothetical protein